MFHPGGVGLLVRPLYVQVPHHAINRDVDPRQMKNYSSRKSVSKKSAKRDEEGKKGSVASTWKTIPVLGAVSLLPLMHLLLISLTTKQLKLMNNPLCY